MKREREKGPKTRKKIAGGFSGWERNTAPLFSYFFQLGLGWGKVVPPAQPASHRPPGVLRHDFLEARSSLPSVFFTPALELLIFVLNLQSRRKSHPCFWLYFFSLSSSFCPPLCTLFSPLMSLCALHELGSCDHKVAESRYATEFWCLKTDLADEELAKIKGKGLCDNHSRVRRPTTPSPPAKKHNTKSLVSPLSPITASSSRSNSEMVHAATQTEEKIETGTKTKTCLGLNNPELEKFVEHRFGKTTHNEDGYLWGKKNQGWTTFRSEFCTGMARSNDAKRCDDCHKLHSAMSQARARKSESSEAHKFVPLSSLRVSPYVKELLEQFKKDQKDNKATAQTPSTQNGEYQIDPVIVALIQQPLPQLPLQLPPAFPQALHHLNH